MPRGEYQPHHHEETREDRVRETLVTLERGIDSTLSSDGFARYLRLMARLPHYSANNLALIYTQRPDATRVAGYRKWQELGRQVRRGEKGITILVPHKWRVPADIEEGEDHVIVRSFGTATVFDVSATDGPPLPEPPIPEHLTGASDGGMRLFVDLWDYLETNGVSVAREHSEVANGYFEPVTNHVGIGYHIDGDQATKTLAHETAHVVAGHRLGMDDHEVETVAESAAFVVLTHYGLDSSGYSFPYVARWAQDRLILKRNLDTVQRVSSAIIGGIEGNPGPAER